MATNVVKIRWRLIAWNVKKILKILIQKIARTKNNRLVMQSKCFVCEIKKSRFVKEQEANGLLPNLGIKTPLSKISLLNILF